MMHILFFTDNFPPEVNAPASRTFEHVRQWVQAGHKVTIITCAPNFPSGKLLEGYKNKLWQTEIIDDIRVIRVWSFITANRGFILRTLDYLSYMIMAVLASPFVRKVDMVIGTSPQFFTVIAAFLASRLKSCPFVFELRDLWPASIKAVGAMKDTFLIHLLVRLEMYLYRKADLIIPVTNAFKTELINRGITSKKIQVITNGVDIRRFRPIPKDQKLLSELRSENCFICGYIGTHGMAHGLETLLDTAEILQRLGENNVKILFLGNGARKEDLVREAAYRHLNNVIFVNSVSKEEVPRYWSLLDVSIVHLRKDDVFKSVIPSKIFESMAMGVPIIHAVEGESADIIETIQCGRCIPSQDPVLMAESILELKNSLDIHEDYKRKCVRGANQFDRNQLAENMLALLTKLNSKNFKKI